MSSQRYRGRRGIASVYRALNVLSLSDDYIAELGITITLPHQAGFGKEFL